MDSMEEGDTRQAISKRKRTKRQRLLLTQSPAHASSSTTSSTELSAGSTTEEEDMANCLILLAQGRAMDTTSVKAEAAATEDFGGGGGPAEKFTSRRFTEAATTTNGKAGFYVYQCKTCDKCFPSFQALGGHRASHKKPRTVVPAPPTIAAADEHGLDLSMNSFAKPFIVPAGNTASKPKVHECSICRSEFSSGQALGGHMRRHRPASIPDTPDAKKERNVLSLDLNLPAPSDDDRATTFSFSGKPPLIFSASALVDCHY